MTNSIREIREPFYTLAYKASEGLNDHLFQVPPELLEDFAELIIKECADVADRNFNNGFCPVGLIIKCYFGVE